MIDVNSGKMVTGKSMEETALRVNLEAVKELARQLRLRDVGGIVIVDLIDMEKDKNRQAVLAALKDAVKSDRMPVKIEGITRLGLLEMTRKRKGEQLRRALRTTCGVCSGSGELLCEEEIARRALRQARRMALAGQRGPFVICLAEKSGKGSGGNAPAGKLPACLRAGLRRIPREIQRHTAGRGRNPPNRRQRSNE